MSSQVTEIQTYLSHLFACEDEILLKIKDRSKKEKLPKISVPSTVGKLLYCLAKIQKTERILELGTLAGYSTLWLARALPTQGKLISIEIDPKHASIARENFKMAGFENKIELPAHLPFFQQHFSLIYVSFMQHISEAHEIYLGQLCK